MGLPEYRVPPTFHALSSFSLLKRRCLSIPRFFHPYVDDYVMTPLSQLTTNGHLMQFGGRSCGATTASCWERFDPWTDRHGVQDRVGLMGDWSPKFSVFMATMVIQWIQRVSNQAKMEDLTQRVLSGFIQRLGRQAVFTRDILYGIFFCTL